MQCICNHTGLAHFERRLISERTKDGIEAARAKIRQTPLMVSFYPQPEQTIKDGKILEIGCGNGFVLRGIKEGFPKPI